MQFQCLLAEGFALTLQKSMGLDGAGDSRPTILFHLGPSRDSLFHFTNIHVGNSEMTKGDPYL